MNYEKLKQKIISSKANISKMCKYVGIERQTYYSNINNENFNVDTFEKICKYLGVDPCEYFDNSVSNKFVSEDQNSYEAKKSIEIELINEQKRSIELLEFKIKVLEGKK
jgi:transcriptional regulator with XRE-family HTH domain